MEKKKWNTPALVELNVADTASGGKYSKERMTKHGLTHDKS